METNNKIFRVVLVLVAIFMAAGYSIVFYLTLDAPVFFHHYYDQGVFVDRAHYQGDISFNLSYITNASDESVVIDIAFPEYPELIIQASEYGYVDHFNWGADVNNTPGEIYGRYSVRTVYCTIIELPDGKDPDGVVLSQARVRFSDHSERTVDIGEVHFYQRIPGETPLEHVSSSSSSDGTGKTSYRTLKELTLTAIDSPLMEKFQERVQWKINGGIPEEAVGMTFQERSILDVTSAVGLAEDIISDYTLFDIQPVLTFTDHDGTQYSQRFYNINSLYHSHSFMDLYRYINAREAL